MQKKKSELLSPPLWLLFLLAGFPQLSETVYSPALPDIAQTLSTSSHLVQWTLSVYFIGFALGVFAWGRVSDHMGRRPTMLMGITVYILGSLFCLLSTNIIVLLLSRIIQGFGASSGSVLTQTIARESLHDQKRHHFFSAVGFAIAFSIALGPLIGGYLTEWFVWRANFVFLLVLGGMVLVFTYFILPETRQHKPSQKKSIFQVLFLLLRDRYVLGSIWLVAVVNGILFSYYAQGPFLFIKLIGLSASQYGWLGGLIALAAFLGSLCSRFFIKKFPVSRLIFLGCSIMTVSAFIMVLACLVGPINASHKLFATLLIMLPMMGIILGSFGFIIPMILSTALQRHQQILGSAGALFGLSYYLLIAGLTWIMGLIQGSSPIAMPIYFLLLALSTVGVYRLCIWESK